MREYICNYLSYEVDSNKVEILFKTGKVIVDVYENYIFRIEYKPNNFKINNYISKCTNELTKDNNLIKKDFILSENDQDIIIIYNDTRLSVSKDNGNISLFYKDKLVHGGNLGNDDVVIPNQHFRMICQNNKYYSKFIFPIHNKDEFYGLGDKGGLCNRRNKNYKFYNRDSLGFDAEKNDPLYKSIPFVIKRKSNNEYIGLFFPALSINEMNFGRESQYYYSIDINNGPFVYYLYVGTKYNEILTSYYKTTGYPLFPPLFSFGFLGSSMNYAESDDARFRIHKYFETIEKYKIPCEGLYLSSGYLKASDGKRYAFLWNKKKFPKHGEYLRKLADRGYKLIVNIKPGILTTHPWYQELVNKGYFIKDSNDQPYCDFYWGGKASLIDFSNDEAKKWWKTQLKQQYLDFGCLGIWNDNNEFEMEDSDVPAYSIKSLLPVLMSETSYEAFNEYDSSVRPWIYSRSGYAGIQKYARTWSGDNCSDWKTLKYNQYQSVSFGLSGMPYYGHDIGGFWGPRPEQELLIRSCESAVLQPRFVIHSWRLDDIPTEPWTYPDALDQIRHLIQEHYNYMPYIYNCAYQAQRYSLPIDRSLHLEFADVNLDGSELDNMFGDSILKVLFVEKGICERTVYLPKNCNWYNMEGNVIKGGSTVKVINKLGNISYFIREGSVIYKGNNINNIDTGLFSDVDFIMYPTSKGEKKGEYFEDDGKTNLNQNKYNLFEWVISSNKLIFRVLKKRIKGKNRIFRFKNQYKKEIINIDPDEMEESSKIIIEF